jgi:hypothetical protein
VAQLQGRGRIDVDEDLLDRRLVAAMRDADFADGLQQMQQAFANGAFSSGVTTP